jgi:polyisoprenoid-binding protein YceI
MGPAALAALALVLTLGLASPAVVPALAVEPAPQWSVDPDHSSVNFAVRHVFATIPGRFARFSGQVRFDPADLAGSSLDFTVDTASVETFVAKRDEHLRTPDFFDAAKHPAIRFQSVAITRGPDGGLAVAGTLTIKGQSRAVELPLVWSGPRPHPMLGNQTVAGLSSSFALDMVDWGVAAPKWSEMGVMGREARVDVYLELLRPR